ncbi:MAG TPA: S9 family peptidase [Steroidobacteraceae bacterium]|nr:S9 family peptidase [Steroidobacteraceae bacterium]
MASSSLRVFAALVPALLLAGSPAVAEPEPEPRRPVTHEDVWLMKRPGAVAVSPDGHWIVVSVSEPAYEDDKKRSDLWIVPSDGSKPPRRLTSGKSAEGDPVFSRDSTRLAFSGKRDGDETPQIYLLELAGGEAQKVTDWATGARAPRFSPDGRSILFVGLAYPGAGSDEDNRKAAAERKERKYNVRAYDSFPIRHWDRWLNELRPTLVLQQLDGSAPPRDLLAGSTLRAGPGFGGNLGQSGETIEAAWTPDGNAVVFAATTDRNAAARAEVLDSLWLVNLAGGEPRRLTGPEGDYSAPSFTDDGATLLAKVRPASDRYVYKAARLVSWPWPSLAQRRTLTADFDESVGDYAAAPDSRRVFFLADRASHVQLFEASLAGGRTAALGKLDSGTYSRLAVGGTSDLPVVAALWGSAVSPHEVGRIDPATGRWSALSTFNTERASGIDWLPVEEFWFDSKRGKRIHSLLVRPPGFDPNRKYPLFVLMHGGPHGMWKDDFIFRWNYHLLAQPGYVVLLTNYSGSTGYGEDFARSIQGDPLAGPADEINEAADEAIRRYSYIDGSRQAAGGASYGGHLANWLAVTTDRYHALVSHAGLYDLRSQWTTSDVVYHRERNIGGPAWKSSLKTWRDQSPFYRSEKLGTPILLTYGEKDFRVPLNNGLEFWTILQRQDVPSRLVVFPDENHWILKGENSRYFYQEVHDWLAKYL